MRPLFQLLASLTPRCFCQNVLTHTQNEVGSFYLCEFSLVLSYFSYLFVFSPPHTSQQKMKKRKFRTIRSKTKECRNLLWTS
jgi:hypothetical protein